MSGPALGEHGAFRVDMPSLAEDLNFMLGQLRTLPGDWAWLDEFHW